MRVPEVSALRADLVPLSATGSRGRLRFRPFGAIRLFQKGKRVKELRVSPHYTKTEGAGAKLGVVVVARRGTQNPGVVVQATAADNAGRTILSSYWINLCTARIGPIPVVHPFPYISVHIIKPPCIGQLLPNGMRFPV